MYYIKNKITGAVVVNKWLFPLYFKNYADAYTFSQRQALKNSAYTIIQIGAIVPRETMGRSGKK